MTPISFAPLLRHLLTNFGGNKQKFAKALGIAPSALSRLLNPRARTVPSLLLCLRMAHLGRTDASRVLRAAGHDEAAQLLEHLYGDPVEHPDIGAAVTAHELAHLVNWRLLAAPDVRALELLIDRAVSARTKHNGPARHQRARRAS
jgi:transcriptional regulator with XRE-family HTH domain